VVSAPSHAGRRWWRLGLTVLVGALLLVELVLGWSSLVGALSRLRAPHIGWLVGALLAETASMRAYARMQRRLLRSAGIKVSLTRHIALAYAAHSLSVTLPGGPAFSTSFNFQQMRRFGASAAVASWAIALSGVLSAGALALISAVGAIVAGGTPHWTALGCYLAAAVGVFFAVRYFAKHPQALHRVAHAGVGLVNRARRRPVHHGRERVTGFIDQLLSVRPRAGHVTIAGWYAIANWLLDAVCLWMSCEAIDATRITTTQLLLAYCAGMAAAGLFPVIPGGLGVIDSALILGLVAGGLSAATAIAAVVLYRIISLGFIIGTGWVLWLIIRHRSRLEEAEDAETAAGNEPGNEPGNEGTPAGQGTA
jgi:putative heme transporter